MGRQVTFEHRLRIERLWRKKKFSTLDGYLERLSGNGFDIAGIPFKMLDFLPEDRPDVDAIKRLGRHTYGGQPRLYAAILDDYYDAVPEQLNRIGRDRAAHPMTRFEAMGWAVYVARRARMPQAGAAARDVFQFWDDPTPPDEVQAARTRWRESGVRHVWYDDAAAQDDIRQGFGVAAAASYAALWHPALKSDVFRLYRLLQHGGVYADADGLPGMQMSQFVGCASGRVWASSMTQVPNCVVNNWFIAAPPAEPFVAAMLDQVLRNIRDVADKGIFWLSGPGAFTTFLQHNAGQFDVGLLSLDDLKTNLFRQFDAPYKHTDRNWRVFEHAAGLNDDAGLASALSAP